MEPNSTLQGRVVVVTGAAGRLGRRVVQHFAGEGALIAAVVRDEAEAHDIPFPEDAEGWAFPADVTDEARVVACFEQIGQRFGRVDVLVHAVGGWAMGPLLETTLDEWEELVRLNLTTAFLCFREAARRMQGGGRLIAFASGSGADGGEARQGPYAAAKAGVVRLVETAADEFRGSGITAHAIAPSTIRYDDASGGASGVRADELVRLCAYLCSPAGDALNGAVLRAYGGA